MVYNIMMNNRKRANLSLLFFTFRKKLIFYVKIYFINRKYEHENITKIDFCYINIINILICRYIEK